MNQKVAAITGITGQDGSYLAELLLNKGYEVHGLRRRSSSFNSARIEHLYKDPLENSTRFFLHYGDITDTSSLNRFLSDCKPDEVYNLAAQSHVGVSFETPEYTSEATALGPLKILESMKSTGLLLNSRFYQASTSELFGGISSEPLNENSLFVPRSPYAASKLMAYWTTVNYREAYGAWAVNGILFNHESPRRGETFVSRKVTRALSRIKHGLQNQLVVGNLNATRDWGHAADYVEAMWKMMQLEQPIDLVISSGTSHSVREFIHLAAKCLDMNIEWKNEGLNEIGCLEDGREIIKVDAGYFRPTEVNDLLGDSSLARRVIDWQPSVTFEELVREMVAHDETLAKLEVLSIDN
jgi:GDPmannose 4,6-dehydratase